MKYISFGKSGEKIPLVGQGTANVGKRDDINYEYLIRLGIDKGMSLIDTAEGYFDGKSEIIIGKAIHDIRDKVFLCTKVSSENLSFDNMIKSAEGSLKRLRTDVIDLYLIHWPNYNINPNETMDAFDELFYKKKVRHFGVSNFSHIEISDFDAMMENHSFGGLLFNQIEYNLFDRYAEYIVRYCRDMSMNIISYCPLNRGKLLYNDGEFLHYCEKKYNRSWHQIAINWVASKNIISIPSSSNEKHTIENSESTDFTMDPCDLDVMDSNLKGKVLYVDPYSINVTSGGYGDRKVYYSKENAINNELGYCPSPVDLSKFLIGLGDSDLMKIKPLRVKKIGEKTYDLYEGRIRYWSWVIAFENSKNIPVYIIED